MAWCRTEPPLAAEARARGLRKGPSFVRRPSWTRHEGTPVKLLGGAARDPVARGAGEEDRKGAGDGGRMSFLEPLLEKKTSPGPCAPPWQGHGVAAGPPRRGGVRPPAAPPARSGLERERKEGMELGFSGRAAEHRFCPGESDGRPSDEIQRPRSAGAQTDRFRPRWGERAGRIRGPGPCCGLGRGGHCAPSGPWAVFKTRPSAQ